MKKSKYLEFDFRPTPMIFGEEGRRFLESTVNVQKESPERLAEMKRHYELFKEAVERGKRRQEMRKRQMNGTAD